jgi:hypothetical protein
MAPAIALSAQNRPYDQVMKEVAPAYANLKTHLDSRYGELYQRLV